MSLTREDFIQAVQAMRDAKRSLAMAAITLDQSEHFDTTVGEIHKVIGDLECSIMHIGDFIEEK